MAGRAPGRPAAAPGSRRYEPRPRHPVLVSIAVIVLVAGVQGRSRHLAAVLATMPLTAPLAIWIVYSATDGDSRETVGFTWSLIAGSVASLAFVVACWLRCGPAGACPRRSRRRRVGLAGRRRLRELAAVSCQLTPCPESP